MAGEKQIYLYNIENKEEKIFYSLKEASNFLKVKNYVYIVLEKIIFIILVILLMMKREK